MSGIKFDLPFAEGLKRAIYITRKMCKDKKFKSEIDADYVFTLVAEITEDEDLNFDQDLPSKCYNRFHEIIIEDTYMTFDQGVIFGANIILRGIEETEGDPDLMTIFLDTEFKGLPI